MMSRKFQIWKKRMWSWWGLDYFCHRKQLSATFWFGGLTFFGGTQILRIKSCLCNNLCKHYLVEFLFYVCTFETYFYLIGIWNKCLKPLGFFEKHLNKNKCTYVLSSNNKTLNARLLCRDTSLSQELHYCSYYVLYKLIPIKLCCVQGL
jgi:hypothetical protein